MATTCIDSSPFIHYSEEKPNLGGGSVIGTIRRASIIALIGQALLLSCAHPLPDVRCDDMVIFEEDAPPQASKMIARACLYYAEAALTSPAQTRRAMVGTRVFFSGEYRSPECSASPGCVRIAGTTAYIYVPKRDWQIYLPHEVYHVLLTRLEPDLATSRHHRRMRELKLPADVSSGQ